MAGRLLDACVFVEGLVDFLLFKPTPRGELTGWRIQKTCRWFSEDWRTSVNRALVLKYITIFYVRLIGGQWGKNYNRMVGEIDGSRKKGRAIDC